MSEQDTEGPESSDLAKDLEELQTALLQEEPADAGHEPTFTWPAARRSATFGSGVEALLEGLMSSHEPAPEEARARLIAAVDQRLAHRRTRSGFLEPLLKASRVRAGKEADVVAKAIGVDPAVLRDLENGTYAIGPDDVDLLASWIVELEDDEGEAVAALERSYRSLVGHHGGAYAGRAELTGLSAEQYAAKVQDAINQMRQSRDRG